MSGVVINDTIPPTVSITDPADSSIVSGIIHITANADDNIGIAGVRFLLDGSSLGSERTAAPYSITWSTTNIYDGLHSLEAIARDAAGNTQSSGEVTVQVDNGQATIEGLVNRWEFEDGAINDDAEGNSDLVSHGSFPVESVGTEPNPPGYGTTGIVLNGRSYFSIPTWGPNEPWQGGQQTGTFIIALKTPDLIPQ